MRTLIPTVVSRIGIGTLAAIAASFLASGCSNVQGTEASPARPVKVQAVSMAPAPAAIRYSATIEPFEQIALAFKTSGYVATLAQRRGADGRLRAAQAGDQVSRSMVLARVNDADYRERVNQGSARLAEGDASLEKARLDLERAETLFAADSLTKPDLDAARASFDTARARLAATRADAELAAIALGDTALVAPATGIILERRVEIGTLVGAGTVAFVMGDVSAVKAHFGVPDSMIDSVKPGDSIGVTVEPLAGATFPGRVTAIAPAADRQSRVFDVEITIPNTDGRLRPGMIGTVSLGRSGASAETPLTVPLSAVVRGHDKTGYAVHIIEHQRDGDITRLRRVELGEVMGNGVAVLKGLSAGDRVVVTGASLLVDGERVRLIP